MAAGRDEAVPRRVVLLGASGRLGRMVRSQAGAAAPRIDFRLQRQGASVPDGGETRTWFRWSFDEPDAVDRLVSHLAGADVILNLAGITPTGGRDWDEADYRRYNVDLAMTVLDAAAAAGTPRVLLASSASVYGGLAPADGAMDEDTPTRPQNVYGRSKLEMERRVAARTGGPEVCALRIGTVAGADMLLQNALAATPDRPMILDRFPSGFGPARSYIGPRLLAQVVADLCVAEGPLPPILNVAGPAPVRMEVLLRALAAQGRAVPWRFRDAPETVLERVVLDVSRLRAVCRLETESAEEMVAAAVPFLVGRRG
ncbi:MAG: NAD(P)-dependent oxidoreductase [Pseudomonadota bacterium]